MKESMDYSLAKRLKEAGFRQGSATGNHHDGGGWIDADGSAYDHEIGNDTECYVPTLPELIAACPTYSEEDGNFALTCMGWKKEGPKWLCGYEKYETYSPECAGETPEEAVANLWLALKNSSV